jgi:hypothetical protein
MHLKRATIMLLLVCAVGSEALAKSIKLAPYKQSTRCDSEAVILGSGEINRAGWGGYSPNERKYFDEFLPSNFERTLVLDHVDWTRGIDWVFTGPRASVKLEIRENKVDFIVTYYDSEGYVKFFKIKTKRLTRYSKGILPTQRFEYTGALEAVTLKIDHSFRISLLLNGKEVLKEIYFPDISRHQLRLVGDEGVVKARLLSPATETTTIDVDPSQVHQTILGWGGIGIATAYQELSDKGQDLWWNYISDYNLLCQREYPNGGNLNEAMDNWDRIEDAKAHYYGDNFPNGEVSDFAYNKKIQDMGGFVIFEFWDFPKWIGSDENKYAAAIVNYCQTAKEKTGKAPRIVGVQNEIQLKEDEVKRFVPALRKALDKAGFADIKIHMSNSWCFKAGLEHVHKYVDNKEVWDAIDYSAVNSYDFQDFFHDPDQFDAVMTEWHDQVKTRPLIATEICVNDEAYQSDSYRIAAAMGILYHKTMTVTDATMILYCWTILNIEQPSFGHSRSLFVMDPANGFIPTPASHQLRVFGSYSRRIKEGMQRVDVKTGNKDLLVSAYNGAGNQATVVMINRSQSPIKPQINWDGVKFDTLEITDPYNQNTVVPLKDIEELVVAPGAIVTLTSVPLHSRNAGFFNKLK